MNEEQIKEKDKQPNSQVTAKKRGRPKKVVLDNNDKPVLDEIREVALEKKAGFNLIEVVIIMIITVLFGTLIGSMISYEKDKIVSGEIPNDLEELVQTYNDLLDNYYEDLDKEALLDAGIKGMIDYLGDPYSTYMDLKETEEFNEKVEGKYVGIGTEIQLVDNNITISNPFEDGPAYEAGLRKGDIIVAVEGESVEGKTLSEVSALIKGKADTKVSITIKRDNEEKVLSVTRKEVDITSVTYDTFDVNDKKIGLITIDIFAANSKEQFRDALTVLEEANIDSLVIDVRDNTGGYLSVVSEIVSMFLDKSKIIYQLETKGVKEPVYSLTKEKRTYPVAVLINSASASASEILASALKESYGAEIIGINSYGKGTVQKSYTLDTGATIKYTIQKWLTPDGNWINDTGVSPTIKEELDVSYYTNPSIENDNQLQKALEVLSEK